LEEVGNQVFSYAFTYGSITFFVTLIVNSLINFFAQKDKPNWVFWKWILSTLFLILCIAFANYFYIILASNNYQFNINHLFSILLNTLLLGVFPLIFIGSLLLFKSRHRNLKIANEMSISDKPIEVKNENQVVLIADKNYELDDLLFLEAMQNYVLIHSISSNKKTVRSTLSNLENELADFNLVRCHRSYLVNVNAIESVSGNAQGLKLHLKNSSEIVPVSRKYISKMKAILA